MEQILPAGAIFSIITGAIKYLHYLFCFISTYILEVQNDHLTVQAAVIIYYIYARLAVQAFGKVAVYSFFLLGFIFSRKRLVLLGRNCSMRTYILKMIQVLHGP